MRGARWLLLVAMAVIIGAVGLTYRAQKRILRDQAPSPPAALPLELNSSAVNWHWRETNQNRSTVEIWAKDFKQVKDSSRVDLTQVELRLYKKDGDSFDLIKSAAAAFFAGEHRLYSDGEVEITLDVPVEGKPTSDLVSIHSSGVNFDSNTGMAETDRLSTFTFRNGDGKSTGASYNPGEHQLEMKKDVEVHWRGKGPHSKPMKIEGGALTYLEAKSEIWLKSWGRMTRENNVVEGDGAVIHLQDGVIHQIYTTKAHGSDTEPNRKLQYGADQVWVDFNDDAAIQKISAVDHAQMLAVSDNSETTIAAPKVEMNFEMQGGESVLGQVMTYGAGSITAKPVAAPGRQPAETHVLRSDQIEMKMRAGGRDIERVLTHAPGQLEFLPNLPSQHHRVLSGNDMVIAYGSQNRIDSFRAKDVRTQTDPTEDERRRNRALTLTSSREMLAHFETGTSRMSSLEQWGDFTYNEGDRRARATKATLDSEENVMLLDTGARVWDAAGSTAADHIRMDQRTGNFTAEGRVESSRVPEKDQKNGMLSGDEPLHAVARKMESTNRNRTIHYEGDVNLWQGANRIQGNVIDVDREKQTLVADGNVISNLWEEPKDEQKKKSATPVLTVVHAAHLVYTDKDRLAYYSGGVVLDRPGMHVESRELRAFLADNSADSRLEKAFAEGGVKIVQTGPDRTRTGTADHGEYYPESQKVVLRGGKPQLVDSLKGFAYGDELTYFANDDRLLINGSPDQPAKSRIRRK